MGTQFPSQKEHSPQFSAHVCCGQTAGWIKIPLGTEVDVGTCDIILDGDPASRKRHSPKISAHVCCGQTARWIKMPLGTEVGFGLDVIVLDGDPAPLKWGTTSPLFGPCLLLPNGSMDQDAKTRATVSQLTEYSRLTGNCGRMIKSLCQNVDQRTKSS